MTAYKSSHVNFGKWGETFVRDELRTLGLVCNSGPPHDLVSGNVVIEVKSARLSVGNPERRPVFQFCLRRWPGQLFTADYLVLLCCRTRGDVNCIYVIPGEHINGNKKIVIQDTHATSKFSAFRYAWWMIVNDPRVAHAQPND
jgi:hypothetical protein